MMINNDPSPKSLRQRRLMLVLPLLVLPFLTLLFWALGGGQGSLPPVRAQGAKGLNQILPEAQLEAGLAAGKLGYYQQAASDSARLLELRKRDAYAFGQAPPTSSTGPDVAGSYLEASPGSREMLLQSRQNSVYQKLEQLQAALREEPGANLSPTPAPPAAGSAEAAGKAELARLEQLMHRVQGGQGADAELQQLNGMLEKILDIHSGFGKKSGRHQRSGRSWCSP